MVDNNNVIPIKGGDQFLKLLKRLSFIPFLILFLLITIPSTIYSVDPDEDAVILYLGKYDRTTGPGLHLKLPWDLEEVIKVPVRKILKLEFGFRTRKAGIRTEYEPISRYKKEAIMLTGDLNVVDVTWIIQYQVKDAKNFLFNVRNVRENLYDLSQAVMREVIGDHTVMEAISSARLDIEDISLVAMQKILDEYKMGIKLVALKLQDVYPPDKVKPSFDEVNSAVQDANQIANLAQKRRQKLVQEEKGKAEQMVKNAQAYKVNLVNHAKGDTNRFLALYKEYKKAPKVTKKRLYFDSVKDVIGNANKIFVVDKDIKGILPLLKLNGGN
jgi:modulator of FtsH protease HflK